MPGSTPGHEVGSAASAGRCRLREIPYSGLLPASLLSTGSGRRTPPLSGPPTPSPHPRPWLQSPAVGTAVPRPAGSARCYPAYVRVDNAWADDITNVILCQRIISKGAAGHLSYRGIALPALGNDQGHVVRLFKRTERSDITNDRSNQHRRRLVAVPSQRLDKALLSELLARCVKRFRYSVGIEGERVSAQQCALPGRAIPFLEQPQNGEVEPSRSSEPSRRRRRAERCPQFT